MAKKDETIDAEVIEEGAVILSPFKDLDLSGGVDLGELMKTYAEVPEIDPEAENAGEQYQYVLKGHKAFVTARNKIEKVRKILVAPALAFNKDVNQRAKDLAYSISAKELALYTQRKLVEDNEQRKQDEAERIERERTGNIRQLITSIQNMAMAGIGLKSSTLKDMIESLEIPDEANFEEFTEEAMGYYKTTMTQLESLYETAVKAEESDKINAEAEAKRIEADKIAEAKHLEEKEALRIEREEFEAEKREMREAKALRDAEANAEAEEKAEIEESKIAVEEVMSALAVAKELTDNEVYKAYAKGGVEEILSNLYNGDFTHVRWEV